MTERDVKANVESLIAKGLAFYSAGPDGVQRVHLTREGQRARVKIVLTVPEPEPQQP